MLSREALNAALPLTEALDSANLFVTAAEGTPLAALVAATRSDDNYVLENGRGDFTPDIESIEFIANTKDPVLGFSKHDQTLDEIAAELIKAVQGHIALAKTAVAPAVQELVEKTAETLAAMQPSSLLGMEVVVWNPPAPFTNASFESSVRRFEEQPFFEPALALNLPDQSLEQLRELIQTGTAGLDADVRDWLATKGNDFLMQVWEELFQQKQAELNDTRVRRFNEYFISKETGGDYALAVYLLARKLVEDPLPGTEMPLARYEELIVEFRNQAGLHLCRQLDDLDAMQRNKMLVRQIKGTVTVVNGPVYREWIEAGGQNEVLFGNVVDATPVFTLEQIAAKAAGLLAIWNKHCALTTAVEKNRRFLRTKQILEKHFREQLFAATEDDPAVTGNREMVLKLFRDQLEQVGEAELDDLYHLCLRLVCRSRFVQTDAERILSGIERAQKDNPELDVREAAAISVIDYIAYWVAAQLKVQQR